MKATTPTRSKSPRSSGFRVTPEKFTPMRAAVLASVPRSESGIGFDDLCARVEKKLSAKDRARYGSLPWYAKVAQLDLEANGLVRRVGGAPLRLTRA